MPLNVGELFVRLGLDSSQYDAAMKQAEKKANTLGGILKNALSFTLGMGFFEAIKQGFKAVVGEAVNFNSMMEQARIGFSTMLGSAEKAQAFLNEMSEFAAKTPFEFPELLDAAKRMMTYGFAAKDVLPIIRAVGDASAGLGLGTQGIDRIVLALGQMRAKSKVSGDEMRQLTEAGVPAWEMLAEALNKTTTEVMSLASKGVIPAGEAIQALVAGLNKRFGGLMENMQNTWQGVTSTIKDVWRMTVGAISSELFKGATAWLGRLRDMATSFYNTFTMLRQQGLDTATALKASISYAFGAGIGSVASMIINAVQNIWKVLVRAAVIIRTHWSSIRFVLLTVLSALLMFKVVLPTISWFITLTKILNGTLQQASGLFGFITRAVEIYRLQLHLASMSGIAFTGVLANIRLGIYAVYSALGPLGAALLVISALLGGLMWLWGKYSDSVQKANTAKITMQINKSLDGMSDNLGNVGDNAIDAASGIKDVGKATSKASKAAKGGLAAFDEIYQVMGNIATSAGELTAGGVPALPEISAPDISMPQIDVGSMLDFKMAKTSFIGFLKWLWDEFKKTKVWSWSVKTWEWIKEQAKKIWKWIKQYIISPLKDAWDWIVDAWNTIKSWLGQKWNDIVELAQRTWGWVKEHIIKPIGEAWNWLVNAWDSIGAWLEQKWNDIVNTARTIWGWIEQHIISPIQRAWNWLRTTWDSIKAWLSNKWNDIANTARTVWDWVYNNIVNPVKRAWDWLISTWNSIKAKLGEIWDSISSKASSIWKGIGNTIIRFINGAIDAINGMIQGLNSIKINFPSWVPFLGGKSLGFNLGTISTIPYLAQGGIVTSPTLAMIGEAGAEAVVPLERNTGWIDELARKLAAAVQGAQVGGSGDIIIQIGDEKIGRIAMEQIRRAQRQAGKTLIPV